MVGTENIDCGRRIGGTRGIPNRPLRSLARGEGGQADQPFEKGEEGIAEVTATLKLHLVQSRG